MALKLKRILAVVIFNIIAIAIILIGFSFIIRGYFYVAVDTNPTPVSSEYNTNTIRTTYPNYANVAPEKALAIFQGFAEPKTEYLPFVGWRRLPYNNLAVNIEAE